MPLPHRPKVYPTYLSPEGQAVIAAHAADLKARREQIRREEQARRFVESLLRDVARGTTLGAVA